MKSWTYAEITEAAEKRIVELMALTEGKSYTESQTLRDWAYGVYDCWGELTTGWQNDGDRERLKKLTRGEAP